MSEKSTITIDAPLAEVTAVLFDIENYPTWSSAIKKVDDVTKDAAGNIAKASVSIDAGVMKDRVDLSYDFSQAPGLVTFSLEDANLMTSMDGSYVVKSLDSDTTEVTYELGVTLSLPVPSMMVAKVEKATITTALEELKARVEG